MFAGLPATLPPPPAQGGGQTSTEVHGWWTNFFTQQSIEIGASVKNTIKECLDTEVNERFQKVENTVLEQETKIQKVVTAVEDTAKTVANLEKKRRGGIFCQLWLN